MPNRDLEQELWQHNRYVAGIDEVGRGPLAGPVVVAAVVLPKECELPGVRDSKQLSHLQRVKAAATIKRVATAIGVGWVTSGEIDRLGLTAALGLAASRALAGLSLTPDIVVVDGKHNYLRSGNVHTQIKADQTCLAVAAASVVAKVARDNYMELISRAHPEYGWQSNKGYGSAAHINALQEHGASPYHRRSFRPVAEAQLVHH